MATNEKKKTRQDAYAKLLELGVPVAVIDRTLDNLDDVFWGLFDVDPPDGDYDVVWGAVVRELENPGGSLPFGDVEIPDVISESVLQAWQSAIANVVPKDRDERTRREREEDEYNEQFLAFMLEAQRQGFVSLSEEVDEDISNVLTQAFDELRQEWGDDPSQGDFAAFAASKMESELQSQVTSVEKEQRLDSIRSLVRASGYVEQFGAVEGMKLADQIANEINAAIDIGDLSPGNFDSTAEYQAAIASRVSDVTSRLIQEEVDVEVARRQKEAEDLIKAQEEAAEMAFEEREAAIARGEMPSPLPEMQFEGTEAALAPLAGLEAPPSPADEDAQIFDARGPQTAALLAGELRPQTFVESVTPTAPVTRQEFGEFAQSLIDPMLVSEDETVGDFASFLAGEEARLGAVYRAQQEDYRMAAEQAQIRATREQNRRRREAEAAGEEFLEMGLTDEMIGLSPFEYTDFASFLSSQQEDLQSRFQKSQEDLEREQAAAKANRPRRAQRVSFI